MSEPVPLVDVLVRQRDAWRRGERPPVEALLLLHPHLAGDHDALLDLVYNEHLLREEFGPVVPVADFLKRFPALADDLRLQFEVDQAFETVPFQRTVQTATVDEQCRRGGDAHGSSIGEVAVHLLFGSLGVKARGKLGGVQAFGGGPGQ